ncbi:type II secretion system major pseudopilin GspG [bacterium]|nr:MAG: type II secretion system major pseudopilin GspG [bacterium]QQR62233.1 MAG: type II secretion system major pseudopilin GspG [bacterium]QQR63203.1 MAG: type II secretion system major pseudopilin GspG [bacterium]
MTFVQTEVYPNRLKRGFSIVEMMFVIAIMAVVLGVLAPNLNRYLQSSRKTSAKSTIRTLKGSINMFNAHIGRYPTSLNELIKKPSEERAAKKWEGPYIDAKEVPSDPWGERYVYKLTPQTEHPYELHSYGQNGRGAPKSEWISVWDE